MASFEIASQNKSQEHLDTVAAIPCRRVVAVRSLLPSILVYRNNLQPIEHWTLLHFLGLLEFTACVFHAQHVQKANNGLG
jgi:hypothetical protein